MYKHLFWGQGILKATRFARQLEVFLTPGSTQSQFALRRRERGEIINESKVYTIKSNEDSLDSVQ